MKNTKTPETAEKPIKKEWVIVGTSNFDSVQNECKRAKDERLMIGVIGSTGAGKTTRVFPELCQV